MSPSTTLALLVTAVLCSALQTRGSLVLQTQNHTFEALADMPADFGPLVPPEGVEGMLVVRGLRAQGDACPHNTLVQVADPLDGCTVLKPPTKGTNAWIALIARSQRVKNCTFDVKVHNAEAAGAVAAIVFDDVLEALIIMSKPKDHKEDPGIPSVFVSQRSGDILQRHMVPGKSRVVILPISDAIWVSLIMSTMAGFLAVTVVAATFYCLRRHRGRIEGIPYGYSLLRSEGMSAAQLRKLPIIIHDGRASSDARQAEEDEPGAGSKGGGTLRTCAVCLEDYKDGEKLRVLPCNHRFHRDCIDQWLSTRQPLCPICKHDACNQSHDDGEAAPHSPSPPPPRAPGTAQLRRVLQGLLPTLQRGDGDRRATAGTNAVAVVRGHGARRRASADGTAVHATPLNFPGMHFVRMPDLEAGGHVAGEPEIQASAEEGVPTEASSLTVPLLPSSS